MGVEAFVEGLGLPLAWSMAVLDMLLLLFSAFFLQIKSSLISLCIFYTFLHLLFAELLSLQEGKSELFFLVFHPPFISQRFYAFLFSPKVNTGNSQARLLTCPLALSNCHRPNCQTFPGAKWHQCQRARWQQWQ